MIDDLLGISKAASSTDPYSVWYTFPLFVKAGSSIGARARTAHTSNNSGYVLALAYGGNSNPSSWWCGQKVSSVGVNPAASTGTPHTAGNSGAYSTWANFGSTLDYDCGAILIAAGGEDDASATSLAYYFEVGIDGQRIGSPAQMVMNSTVDAGYANPYWPCFTRVGAGSQLQVRGTCSGTAQAISLAVYCVN